MHGVSGSLPTCWALARLQPCSQASAPGSRQFLLQVRDETVWRPELGVEFIGGGQTPLHVAAANGNVEATRALLAAGADVNAVVGPPESIAHYWPV